MNYAQSCFTALERRRRIALCDSIVTSMLELEDEDDGSHRMDLYLEAQADQASAALRGIALKWLWSPSYGQHETLYAVDRRHALERLEFHGLSGGTLMVHPDDKDSEPEIPEHVGVRGWMVLDDLWPEDPKKP